MKPLKFKSTDKQVYHLLLYITTLIVLLGIFHIIGIFFPLWNGIDYQWPWDIPGISVKHVSR